MDLVVTVHGDQSLDAIRSLHEWLIDEELLRGLVKSVEPAPRPGSLGSAADTLAVSVGPGGAAAVLVGAVVSWVRHRTGDVSVVLRRGDGERVEVSARRVRGLDADAVQVMVDRLTGEASPDAAGTADSSL